jgi:hypothetical protein
MTLHRFGIFDPDVARRVPTLSPPEKSDLAWSAVGRVGPQGRARGILLQ